jgi:hypothetical protein
MQKRVISGVKSEAMVLWVIAIAIATGVMLYKDVTDVGLRGTLLFRSMGYMVHPVFYGGMAYLLFRFGRLLVHRNEYLTVTAGSVVVGGKVIPIDDLELIARRNFLGLREIAFWRNGKQEHATKAYYFSRPFAEVMDELNDALAKHRAEASGR